MKDSTVCPICNGPTELSDIMYKNYFYPDIKRFNSLEIITCTDCGFSFTIPELDQDFLEVNSTVVYTVDQIVPSTILLASLLTDHTLT